MSTEAPSFSVRLIPRPVEPPIDLTWLVEWLGIELEYRPLPKSVSGLYLRTEQRSHILLNSNDTPERQRYSLAHELAHHLLAFIDGWSSVFALDIKHSSREAACNRFAAELLMPEDILRRCAAKVKHGPHDKSALLANIFEVSATAMRIRLRELRLDSRRCPVGR